MRLATQQHVAAYFQLRTDYGFEELMTPAFRDIATTE